MPLNTMGSNWGAFNPRSYQSAGRGWGGRQPQGRKQYQPWGQQQSQGGSWQQPSQGRNPWMQQRPYGGPQKGYRAPSGRGGGIGGASGMRRQESLFRNDPWESYDYTPGQQRMQAAGMNPAEIHLMSNPFTRGEYMQAMGVPEDFMRHGGNAYLSLMMQGRAPSGQHQPWGLNQYSNSGGNPWGGGF